MRINVFLGSAVAAASMAVATIANAASISFTDSIGMQPTNWDDQLTVSQFDPSLGTLTSIMFQLTGSVMGDASYESLDNGPATITLNLASTITLDNPNGGPAIIEVLPLASVTEGASAFDGTIDFDGPSGSAFIGLTNSTTDSATLLAGFAPFIGLGTIDLNASAAGTSSGSGAGNLVQIFSTNAGADLIVTYNFDTATDVPGPAALSLLGAGLMGIGAVRRRKSI